VPRHELKLSIGTGQRSLETSMEKVVGLDHDHAGNAAVRIAGNAALRIAVGQPEEGHGLSVVGSQLIGFVGSGFFVMPTVSDGGYVRSIVVRTRFSCYAPRYVCFAKRLREQRRRTHRATDDRGVAGWRRIVRDLVMSERTDHSLSARRPAAVIIMYVT
jgi:hypothetical protein